MLGAVLVASYAFPVKAVIAGKDRTLHFDHLVVVAAGLTLSLGAAATVFTAGAAVGLVAMRRRRATLPWWLFNAAQLSASASIAFLVAHAVGPASVGRSPSAAAVGAVILGSAVGLLTCTALVLCGAAMQGPVDLRRFTTDAYAGLLPVWAGGVMAGVALAVVAHAEPWAVPFLAGLFAMVLGGSAAHVRAVRDRDRLEALVDAAVGAYPAVSGSDVERILEQVARRVLGVGRAAIRAAPPGPGELGTPMGQGGPDDLWLVATGPPHRRPFDDSDARFLAGLGAVGSAALGRAELLERLAFEALHDPLTGLPNRALLHDRMQQALARCRRTGVPLAVLFLDMDQFKLINDSRGHSVGDEVLLTIGQRLLQSVRPQDTVARFGGDEFVILCEGMASRWDVALFADRLLDVVSGPIAIGDTEVVVTASVGMAVAEEVTDPDELLQHADAAMYLAKSRGRGKSEFFEDRLRGLAHDRLSRENDLRRAVAEGQLRLVYQPIVTVEGGVLTGVEALVRWDHPTDGELLPSDFIPLAEETGLVVDVGAWVLDEACRQAAEWNRAGRFSGPVRVAVNLSAHQLSVPGIVALVEEALRRHGLPPDQLVLEVTETAVMADVALSRQVLTSLRAQGVHLSVDDFGTGYSSLAYLRRFPVESLKIDREFVSGLGASAYDASIVAAVIALGRALGMSVVAEGVESPLQLAALRALGCDAAQGFLLSPPVRPEDLGPLPGDLAPSATSDD